METLLNIGLQNALVASVLALAAGVLTRWCRRPALTHGLWLLVLLKLITPPLLPVELPWPAAPDVAHAESTAAPRAEHIEVWMELDDAEENAPLPLRADALAPSGMSEPAALTAPASPMEPWPWRMAVLPVWLAGSGVWFLVAAGRIWRFRRLLRFAQAASPELQAEAGRLAQRLGLARGPNVWMVPGTVSPMLWAIAGRPRLLLPAALWGRLNDDQRAALLAHELAHLRRHDHWVRRLEFVVTGLYWWHPAVWWARREIGAAEEECCDAWVVWALPAAARAYALALMETVDFLSETRTVLPPAVSGIGHVRLLRRRLAMIMLGTTPRALSGAGFWGLLGLGALVLPLLPTWAQEPKPKADGDKPAAPARVEQVDKKILLLRPGDKPGEVKVIEEQPGVENAVEVILQSEPPMYGLVTKAQAEDQHAAPPAPAGLEEARDEVELLRAQLDVKRAGVREVQARLAQASRRLARAQTLNRQGALSKEELANLQDEVELAKTQLEPKDAEIREAEIRLRQAQRRLERLQGSGAKAGSSLGQLPRQRVRVLNQMAPADGSVAKEDKEIQELLNEVLKGAGAKNFPPETRDKLLNLLRSRRDAEMQAQRARAEEERAKAEKAKADAALKLKGQLRLLDNAKVAGEKEKAERALNDARKQLKVAGEKRTTPANPQTDARLKELESKLDTLTRELEALRNELKKQAPRNRAPGGLPQAK